MGCRRCQGCIGSGRECRYSGSQKGYRWHKGALGLLRGAGSH